jgi:hypothetical protein
MDKLSELLQLESELSGAREYLVTLTPLLLQAQAFRESQRSAALKRIEDLRQVSAELIKGRDDTILGLRAELRRTQVQRAESGSQTDEAPASGGRRSHAPASRRPR